MSDLAERTPPRVVASKPAHALTYHDRGRLIVCETPAAIYVGALRSIIFHAYGQISLTIERDGTKGHVTIDADTMIAFGS